MHTCLRSIIWVESWPSNWNANEKERKNTNDRTKGICSRTLKWSTFEFRAIRSAEYAQNSNKKCSRIVSFFSLRFLHFNFQLQNISCSIWRNALVWALNTDAVRVRPSYSRNESVSLFLEFFFLITSCEFFSKFSQANIWSSFVRFSNKI